MARSILLIDPDVDALGALASRLRSRGLEVTLADQLEGAAERTRRARPDAVLICESLLGGRSAAAGLSSEKELQDIPCFALMAIGPGQLDSMAPDQLPRSDVDLIVKRLFALPKTPPPVEARKGDFRGDIEQVSVVDLLQLLGMNRRTGALTLTTPSGVGEVRLVKGDIVDAVYRRLEGEKALYRLLAEPSGSFAFVSSLGTSLRRVETPTHHLLIDGMRRIDEVAARRESLQAGSDALLSVVPPGPDASEVEHQVSDVLSIPRTVDELLDELPLGDLEILDAVIDMLSRAKLRRIPRASARVELADPEQMSVLSAMVSRLAPAGYRGHPRVVIAAKPERIGALAHAVCRISDATPSPESPPTAPVPHLLATLSLGEGVELEVVGLPVVPEYAPLWQLSLAGAAALLQLEDGEQPAALEATCAVAEVPLINAAAILGGVDESEPQQVALLIRAALEQVAGEH